jgi:hypothetical protein
MSTAAVAFEPADRMSRDDYRAWAARQPGGRFERMNGVVVARAPERIGHNRRKGRAYEVLDRAVRTAGLPCEVYTDGVTVEVGDSDFEPDAVVHCGPRCLMTRSRCLIQLSSSRCCRPAPAPSTVPGNSRSTHYLIICADKEQIAHHRRSADG